MLLDLPLDLFGEITHFLAPEDLCALAIISKTTLEHTFKHVTSLTLNRRNVVRVGAFLKHAKVPKLEGVVLLECFFPVWQGVPTFLPHLKVFEWTTGAAVHVVPNAPRTGLVTVEGIYEPDDDEPEYSEDKNEQARFLEHARACLGALDVQLLTRVVLDNEDMQYLEMGDTCLPLLENCCRAPMPNMTHFLMNQVLSEHQFVVDYALLECLRTSWTMPNLVEFALDDLYHEDLARYNEKVTGRNGTDDTPFEEFTDKTMSVSLRLMAPVIARCNPATLKRVMLHTNASSNYELGNGDGKWVPRSAEAAVAAVEKVFGQRFGVLCTDGFNGKPKCFCDEVITAAVYSVDFDEKDVHALGRCTLPTFSEIYAAYVEERRREWNALPDTERTRRRWVNLPREVQAAVQYDFL